jgi:hypothetical protein
MNKRCAIIFVALTGFLAITSCKRDHLAPETYLNRSEADTLLTDLVTYIYPKPKNADNKTRHNPEFRKYFVKSAGLFKFEYYTIVDDSTHYFYLIRPARSLKGNLRGVGGKFRIDHSLKGSRRLTGFEELFNTVVMPEDSLKVYGRKIMKYLVKHKHLDPFLYDPAIVEWPDQFLKYDKSLQEWRYVPSDSVMSNE